MKSNNEKRNHRDLSSGLWMGGTLIAIGAVMLGKSSGYIVEPWSEALNVGTLILTILGLYALSKRQLFLAFAFVAAAVGVGLARIDHFEQWRGYYWAAVLIVGGIALIANRACGHGLCRCHHHSHHGYNSWRVTDRGEAHCTNDEGMIDINTAFSGVRHDVVDTELKGGNIACRFGGVTLDLRRATLPEGETALNVSLKTAGLELYVPSTWEVRSEINAFLGGIEDTRPRGKFDTGRCLVLRGEVNLSGITIKG